MKRVILSVVGIVAFAAFLYVQPLLTIRVLARSLAASDGEAMRERMDFERVKHGLKEDFSARLGVGRRLVPTSGPGQLRVLGFARTCGGRR